MSAPGQGSTFTLYLPVTYSQRLRKGPGSSESERQDQLERAEILPLHIGNRLNQQPVPESADIGQLVNEVGDDRDFIQSHDKVILIVENDLSFARYMLDIAREKECKGLVTSYGAVALALAHDYQPDAVMLDINLLDMQGWRVLERLKNDITTRHIPIYVISTDEARDRALMSAATAFIGKPLESGDVVEELVDRVMAFADAHKTILTLGLPAEKCEMLEDCMGDEQVHIVQETELAKALEVVKESHVDCMIVSPQFVCANLANALLESDGKDMPITFRTSLVVWGEGAVEAEAWKRLGEAVLLGRANTDIELLNQATFHLRYDIEQLPEKERNELLRLSDSSKLLAGRKVLIVDDDMRNIFALSSVLEEHQMRILSADNGRDAINILQSEKDVDIVLMDIMMPEMDGMETMREIRKFPQLKDLPIVAVTAKAMKGDREKCIEAGAWDYLSKPVDTEQMINVLRAWLHRNMKDVA